MKSKRSIKTYLLFSLLILNLLIILVSLNCKEDKTLYRATSDYFPLKTGMIWYYANNFNNTDTSIVKVIGDTSAYGRSCILVNRGSLEEYWIKDKSEIKKLVEIKINRAGFDFFLEQDYRQYFQLPLIKDNSWRDSLNNSIDVQGDMINFRHIIFGKVEDIKDISTPAGEFSEVYRISLVDTLQIDDSLVVKTSFYWFAPEVGIVKQRFETEDTVEQILVQFTSNN